MAKSRWDEVKEKLMLVEAWCRDGLTDEQIAKNLGIGKTAFYDYKNKHTEFANVLKRNKEIVDIEVENALLKRAKGYSYIEKKKVTNPDGSIIETETVKEVLPDTTAQIFWLKNRKRLEWRDRQEIEMNADVTYTVAPNDLLSPEE